MKTCLVVVTHNRIEYTKKCLDSVFSDSKSNFDLCIWDNASSDGTREFLGELRDPRLKKVIFADSNIGPLHAMNVFWQSSDAEFLAKLDNDCLIQPGWLEVLTKAHCDIPQLGAVACWHYRIDDFDESAASRKIQVFGNHKVFRHPWVCGSGFVMKKSAYIQIGAWPEGSADIGTTGYFLRMAKAGFINGWYFPLVLQHHMDDPLSPYCHYHDDESLLRVRNLTFTLRNRGINSMCERLERRAEVLRQLHEGSIHPESYMGLWFMLRKALRRIRRPIHVKVK